MLVAAVVHLVGAGVFINLDLLIPRPLSTCPLPVPRRAHVPSTHGMGRRARGTLLLHPRCSGPWPQASTRLTDLRLSSHVPLPAPWTVKHTHNPLPSTPASGALRLRGLPPTRTSG
jgi:hypothetical protein